MVTMISGDISFINNGFINDNMKVEISHF